MEGVCERVLIIREGRLIRDVQLKGETDGAIRFRARIAMGKDRLLALLRSCSWISEVTAQEGTEPGITDILVSSGSTEQPERLLFTLMTENNAPILMLTRERSTLENIFLEAMKE